MNEAISKGNERPIETTGGEEMFRATVDAFRRNLQTNRDQALDRYGMTLYHSLPLDRRTVLGRELGFLKDDAITRYNLGIAAVSEENWTKAIEYFQKSLELDSDLNEALYNLALAKEKNGDVPGAVDSFRMLLSHVRDNEKWAEDVESIESHLQELEA